jgi:hypothetical protein
MPTTTILQCPHCGNAAKTTKVIPPGAKITCTRCRKQFPFRPSGNGPVEDRREEVVDSIPLEELLAPDDLPSKAGRPGQGAPERSLRELMVSDGRASRPLPSDDEPPGRYNSVTNSILTNSSEIAENLLPASESSKQRLIGGKHQVRFGTSRQYVAVVLVFALAGAGYLGFWGFVSLIKYIQAQSDAAKNYRERMAKATTKTADPKKKGAEPAEPAEPAAPLAPPALVQAEAGKPAQANEWEVCVEKAEVGRSDPANAQEYLVITLRVTNLAFARRPYRYWSKPSKNTVIRNQNLAYLHLIPGTAPKEDERGMNSKETYRDILVLEASAARFELDLTLLLPSGKGGFHIQVPSTFVTSVE